MAAYARPATPQSGSAAQAVNSGQRTSSLSPRRSLPQGACHFRNVDLGLKAPTCGCRQFWCGGSHQHMQAGPGSSQLQSNKRDGNEWCACGHHACFHEANERRVGQDLGRESGSPGSHPEKSPIYLQLLPSKGDAGYQLVAGSQPVGVKGFDRTPTAGTTSSQPRAAGARDENGEQDRNRHATTIAVEPVSDGSERCTDNTSGPGVGGTPAAPSLYLPNPQDYQPPSSSLLRFMDIHARDGRSSSDGLRQSDISALGLVMPELGAQRRAQSPSSTIPDAQVSMLDRINSFSPIPSTRNPSSQGDERNTSPSRAFLQQALQSRARFGPPLEITYPNAIPVEDLIQSATEVATPSANNTPDLRGLEQAVHETRTLIETLNRHNPNHSGNASGADSDTKTGLGPDTAANFTPPLSSDPSTYQATLRKLPVALQHLVPHLSFLRDHLTTYPQISTSIKTLSDRMDAFESSSFSHHSDGLHDKVDMVEGRVIEIEGRMDDHDKLHAAIDADLSSRDPHFKRRGPVNEGASFTSQQSFHSSRSMNSTSSSALIAAAIDRAETDARLKDVEERLEDLETCALPSYTRPWNVEVVLLPWGRALRGIWFASDNQVFQASMSRTQDPEEWAESRNLKSSGMATSAVSETGEGGWSSQAIHDWADASEEWLSPKACGVNGMIYKRLCSRGLVRKITLRHSGAREIQAAISAAYGDLLETISSTHADDTESRVDDHEYDLSAYLGLRAAVIPLRKVHKQSRLRFLNPGEMVSPAIWTADFLSSGVIMRAGEGQKRLFVTHRDAYLQLGGEQRNNGWTWQGLRELPRVHLNQSGSPDSTPRVGEADAKEACWSYHPDIDPPISIHSSFASNASGSSYQQRRSFQSIGPLALHQPDLVNSGIDPVHYASQPITPLSEHPNQRTPRHLRGRTQSVPITETSSAPAAVPLSKRRIASFEQTSSSSNAKSTPRDTAGREISPSKSRLPKRRRLTHSPDPLHSVPSHAYQGFTPRRSKEPPSPYFASAADADERAEAGARNPGSRYLQQHERSGPSPAPPNIPGKGSQKRERTPFAYATPYSGTVVGVGRAEVLLTGAGDTERDSESEDGEVWEGVQDEGDADVGAEDEGDEEESEFSAESDIEDDDDWYEP